MRFHRFFIGEPLSGKKTVKIKDRDLLHQLKHVFRFQIGHKIILLDNSGYEFEAQITSLSGMEADFEIHSSEISKAVPSHELWLFMSLIKKDKFEWVLEKGTEIGVSHFVPVLAERSEKKNFNRERGEKIIKEAVEQSGRAKLPELRDICELEDALRHVPGGAAISSTASAEQKFDQIIVLDSRGTEKFEREVAGSKKNARGAEGAGSADKNQKIALFIGPEGGWSDREIALFKKQNMAFRTLGNATLRAETAAIVAANLLLL